jgi:calcium-dependent protein kinase
LLCGYPPFNGSKDDQIIKAVLAGKYSLDEPEWADVSAEAKDLVTKLLTYDPDKRITAFDALKHPWITKFGDSDKVDKTVAKRTLQNL